jgi:hypothetical protein
LRPRLLNDLRPRLRAPPPEPMPAAQEAAPQLAWPRATGLEQAAKQRPVPQGGLWAPGPMAPALVADELCLAHALWVGSQRQQGGRA